jgi:hypothetical protein
MEELWWLIVEGTQAEACVTGTMDYFSNELLKVYNHTRLWH